MSSNSESEQHPMLPSGYWTGFYVYAHSAERHEMMIMLDFMQGNISGDGSDDIGTFTFDGTYNLSSMTCQFIKHYRAHSIDYHGHIDENGIWGKWYFMPGPTMSKSDFEMLQRLVPNRITGGFHIWPSNKEFSEYELEMRKVKEEEVVKEVG